MTSSSITLHFWKNKNQNIILAKLFLICKLIIGFNKSITSFFSNFQTNPKIILGICIKLCQIKIKLLKLFLAKPPSSPFFSSLFFSLFYLFPIAKILVIRKRPHLSLIWPSGLFPSTASNPSAAQAGSTSSPCWLGPSTTQAGQNPSPPSFSSFSFHTAEHRS